MPISEQTIVDALRQAPVERWGEVLAFLQTLQGETPAIRTAADLANSELIGLWAARDDIGNSQEFARSLRREAETR